jgi:hypothetical protein
MILGTKRAEPGFALGGHGTPEVLKVFNLTLTCFRF